MSITISDLRLLLGHGGREPAAALGSVRISSEITRPDGVRVMALDFGPAAVPATCLWPAHACGVGVLYCHAHGNRPEIGSREVIDGRPALSDPPLGLALARAGAVVLCPDMPGFGARQGPESALAKAALWRGRTLIGDMVADLEDALAVLFACEGVDPMRIAVCGISMGGTLAYLTAALQPGIAACAQMAVFADIGPLVETGAHDLHGPYMTLPGLLSLGDLGDLAGLVAPRPQFVATGAADPLTPDAAYVPALARLRAAYAARPEALTVIRDPSVGHVETREMRAALLGFLAETVGLRPETNA